MGRGQVEEWNAAMPRSPQKPIPATTPTLESILNPSPPGTSAAGQNPRHAEGQSTIGILCQ